MENAHNLPGFRWMPGMFVNHIGQSMLILVAEEDEWLNETFWVLTTFNRLQKSPLCTVFVKNETFLDLKHPATGGCLTELLGFIPEVNDDETLGEACARVATEQGYWTPDNNNNEEN